MMNPWATVRLSNLKNINHYTHTHCTLNADTHVIHACINKVSMYLVTFKLMLSCGSDSFDDLYMNSSTLSASITGAMRGRET